MRRPRPFVISHAWASVYIRKFPACQIKGGLPACQIRLGLPACQIKWGRPAGQIKGGLSYFVETSLTSKLKLCLFARHPSGLTIFGNFLLLIYFLSKAALCWRCSRMGDVSRYRAGPKNATTSSRGPWTRPSGLHNRWRLWRSTPENIRLHEGRRLICRKKTPFLHNRVRTHIIFNAQYCIRLGHNCKGLGIEISSKKPLAAEDDVLKNLGRSFNNQSYTVTILKMLGRCLINHDDNQSLQGDSIDGKFKDDDLINGGFPGYDFIDANCTWESSPTSTLWSFPKLSPYKIVISTRTSRGSLGISGFESVIQRYHYISMEKWESPFSIIRYIMISLYNRCETRNIQTTSGGHSRWPSRCEAPERSVVLFFNPSQLTLRKSV